MHIFSLLQSCVEQIFDDSHVFVTKNTLFAEEFALNIRIYLAQLEPRIGESRTALSSLVQTYGLWHHFFRFGITHPWQPVESIKTKPTES